MSNEVSDVKCKTISFCHNFRQVHVQNLAQPHTALKLLSNGVIYLNHIDMTQMTIKRLNFRFFIYALALQLRGALKRDDGPLQIFHAHSSGDSSVGD
jgi:hypothetical protein